MAGLLARAGRRDAPPSKGALGRRRARAATAFFALLALVGATTVVAGTVRDAGGARLGSALPARLPASTGGTYFVDGRSGSDRNPGTKARPWKTINRALRTVPLRGSTIVVRPGTYLSTETRYAITFDRKGDPTNPVTVTAERPGTVRIENADPGRPAVGAWIVNASGLRLRGLTFRIATHPAINPPYGPTAVKIVNSDRIEITDCTFLESGGGHIGLSGGLQPGEVSEDVWVLGNTFRPSGRDPFAQVTGLAYSRDTYFGSKGSHFLYLGAYGDSSKPEYWSGSERAVVANNVFVGTAAGRQVQLGSQARHSFVVGNTFFGNHAGDVLGWTTLPNGAQYAGEGIVLFANVSQPFASRDNVAKNNVLVDMNGRAVYGGTVSMQGNVVERNLSFDTDNGRGYNDDPADAFDNTYGSAVLYSEGAGNWQNLDPRLVDPRRFDFRLRPGSPAVGKADPAFILPFDRAGRERDGAPDLGAHER